MEKIFEVYTLVCDKNIPFICMDKKLFQLLDEKLKSAPMNPGKLCKQDYEYMRKKNMQHFVFIEEVSSWRHVYASEQRTRIHWENHIEELLEVYYPHAKIVRLVMGYLNTHMIGSSYEAFAPEKAL